MVRGYAHTIAERRCSSRLLLEHSLECLLHRACASVGKSGDNGAAGKNLRISRQHYRSHRAAGREAGREHARPIDAEGRNGVLDHLPDRESLAVVSRGVARQEPGETIVWIVSRLLLGIDNRKAETVGELRPAA